MSAAAEQLGLTQPALSKSIRMLEQSLGVRLLDRGPAGVRMTLFGERLKAYADQVLALSDEAVEEIDALRGARRGSLRIGCVAAMLRSLVPRTVAALRDRYPDVDIIVSEGLNDTLVDALRIGRLDLAITARPEGAGDPDLEFRPCWKNRSSSLPAPFTRSPDARVSNLLTWFHSLGSFRHGLSRIGSSLIDYSSRPDYQSHVRQLRRHLLCFSAPCC
jgi:DNA-binding transcriptional LysR family regulator